MEIIQPEVVDSNQNLAQKSLLMLRFKRAPNEIYSSESEEEINVNEIPAYILEPTEPVKFAVEPSKQRQPSPPPPQK